MAKQPSECNSLEYLVNRKTSDVMKLTEIQDLIKFVARAGVTEVEIEQKEFKITIKSEMPKGKGKAPSLWSKRSKCLRPCLKPWSRHQPPWQRRQSHLRRLLHPLHPLPHRPKKPQATWWKSSHP